MSEPRGFIAACGAERDTASAGVVVYSHEFRELVRHPFTVLVMASAQSASVELAVCRTLHASFVLLVAAASAKNKSVDPAPKSKEPHWI